MILIKLDQITVPEGRQRKDFNEDKLQDLLSSIREKGLLHPIVVRPLPDGTFELAAGERRLRCLRALTAAGIGYSCDGVAVEPGIVACTRTTEMDKIALKELEFDENVKRQALTWQEECAALNEIMELRKAQDPTTTRASVARELSAATGQPVGGVKANLAQAEFVAKHLEEPKVAAARTLREAYSVASRLQQAKFEHALREKIGQSTEHECYNDDLLKFLPTLQVPCFDCIIADPPYGVGADEFGTAGPSHEYEDTEKRGLELAACIIREGVRLTKPQAHLYLFCDIDLFHRLRDLAARAGWTPFRTPLIWDKGGASGHNPIPAQAIRRSYECILFASKGDRPALRLISDVIRDFPPVRNAVHAAEKPADLYAHLLARSCKPGDKVLDPCCGVGPIFEAANFLKLRATGIELDKQYWSIADGRRFPKTVLEDL